MTKKFLLIAGLSLTLILNFPSLVKAEGQKARVDLEILPGDTTASLGYFNESSTGFRLNVGLDSAYKPDELQLFVGSCLSPIDSEAYDNDLSYILSSGTSSLVELSQLLQTCSGAAEGLNQIALVGVKDGIPEEIYRTQVLSDFSAPSGVFSLLGAAGKVYKVGDSIPVLFEPTDSDVYSVVVSINGRELTLEKNEAGFGAEYLVMEGDLDVTDQLSLDSIQILDNAGNQTTISKLNVPIDFSIDANSPSISIDSPAEGQVFTRTDLTATYSGFGYSHLNFFLNDQMVDGLSFADLASGQYTLKIVAEDAAGNIAVAIKHFIIDTVFPQVALDSYDNVISESTDLSISGRGEALSRIILTIGQASYETVSDQDGKFSFLVRNLEVGEYDCYLVAFDPYGNQVRIELGRIKVQKVQESITVAKAETERDYKFQDEQKDALSFDNQDISSEEELAQNGKIISSYDERQISAVNYTQWVILAILIVLSVAIASAGYYGMVLIGSARSQSQEDRHVIFEEEISAIITEQPQNIEEEKPKEDHLRW